MLAHGLALARLAQDIGFRAVPAPGLAPEMAWALELAAVAAGASVVAASVVAVSVVAASAEAAAASAEAAAASAEAAAASAEAAAASVASAVVAYARKQGGQTKLLQNTRKEIHKLPYRPSRLPVPASGLASALE